MFGAAGVKPSGGHQCFEWLPDDGFAAARSVLATTRPRALICFNDRLAMGVYQALDDAGLSVPADVSVVSFDDHPIASWIRPKLTTVALPHYELGQTAVEVLFGEIDGQRQGRPVTVGTVHRVPMPVRHRESVAPPGP